MKKKKQQMKITKIIILLLLVNQVFAQQFGTSAKIVNTKTDGIHSILLTPEIRSFSKADLSDLRIFDAKNKEVPYFLRKESASYSATNFEEWSIVSKQITANSSTIIIENKGAKIFDEIVLNIANSKLKKSCNISGSDDQKQWFGLLDKYQLLDLENKDSTNVFTKIELPSSTYHFIKIEIDNKKTAPINVLKLGNFSQTLSNSKKQIATPDGIKTTIDVKTKKTRIIVSFNQAQIIENIAFDIKNPAFYKRNARILVNKTAIKWHKSKKNYTETMLEFELNSTKKNTFDIPTLFEKEFIIEIDNEDNPALEIANMKFSQLATYLITDLKASESYTLKTGNLALLAPNYDISYFKNDISKQLPEATIVEIKTMNNTIEIPKNELPFWQKSWFLWCCIGIAGAAIAYFSSSLLKDMK
jgi:hypothetical protein